VTPSANPIDGKWQTFVVTCSEVALVWLSDACCACVGSNRLWRNFCAVTPTLSPNPSPAPPGGKGGPTAACGLVFEVAEFSVSRQPSKWLSTTRSEWPALPATSIKLSFILRMNSLTSTTRPHTAVGSLFRPAGRERAGGVSGGKLPRIAAPPAPRPPRYSGPHWHPSPEAKAFFDLRHPTDPAAPSSQVSSDAFGETDRQKMADLSRY
jgi:hypothetical protein